MDELVAFVRACLDEDERVARKALADAEGWCAAGPEVYGFWDEAEQWESGQLVATATGLDDERRARGAHIARHDPRSVLARVEAERLIAWEHREEADPWTAAGPVGHSICACCAETWPCETIRALAYGRRHREGWCEEWAPVGLAASTDTMTEMPPTPEGRRVWW